MRTSARFGSMVAVVAWLAAALAACGGQEVRLQRLEISPGAAQVTEHLTTALRVDAIWDDGGRKDVTAEATWSSQDEAVAAVTAGQVRAGAVGSTYVTATWSGLTTSSRVDVLAAQLLSLRVLAGQTTLPAGLSTQLQVLGTYSDGTERDVTGLVLWDDGDGDEDDGGLVDRVGTCHCDDEREVTLRATLDGVTAEIPMTFTAALPVSLTLAGLDEVLPAGLHAHPVVLALLTDGRTADVSAAATLEVADGAVAAVGADGALQALAAGATEVRASYQGLQATATLRVSAAVLVSIEVTLAAGEPEPGHLLYFAATGRRSDGTAFDATRAVDWTTGDTRVAISYAIIQKGAVLARAAGTTEVIATAPASGVVGRYLLVVEADD